MGKSICYAWLCTLFLTIFLASTRYARGILPVWCRSCWCFWTVWCIQSQVCSLANAILAFLSIQCRHLHESQNLANTTGGKTPFGAGGRTPARPGGTTPGHMSVRQAGRTPNPYGGTTPAPYGAPSMSTYGIPPSTPYGYQTPHRPPNYPPSSRPLGPPGMADRATAVPQHNATSGWGTSGWM